MSTRQQDKKRINRGGHWISLISKGVNSFLASVADPDAAAAPELVEIMEIFQQGIDRMKDYVAAMKSAAIAKEFPDEAENVKLGLPVDLEPEI